MCEQATAGALADVEHLLEAIVLAAVGVGDLGSLGGTGIERAQQLDGRDVRASAGDALPRAAIACAGACQARADAVIVCATAWSAPAAADASAQP